jgi:hypothetical protein
VYTGGCGMRTASLYDPKVTGEYAKTWPFVLDPFQEKACAVLVGAYSLPSSGACARAPRCS